MNDKHFYPKILSCDGKIGYQTPQQANKAVRSLSRGSKGDTVKTPGVKVRVVAYKCRYCHRYHLGKNVISSSKNNPLMVD